MPSRAQGARVGDALYVSVPQASPAALAAPAGSAAIEAVEQRLVPPAAAGSKAAAAPGGGADSGSSGDGGGGGGEDAAFVWLRLRRPRWMPDAEVAPARTTATPFLIQCGIRRALRWSRTST